MTVTTIHRQLAGIPGNVAQECRQPGLPTPRSLQQLWTARRLQLARTVCKLVRTSQTPPKRRASES